MMCVQVLASKTKELDKLRSDWSAHTTNLLTEHSVTLSAEKEKALQVSERVSVCVRTCMCDCHFCIDRSRRRERDG